MSSTRPYQTTQETSSPIDYAGRAFEAIESGSWAVLLFLGVFFWFSKKYLERLLDSFITTQEVLRGSVQSNQETLVKLMGHVKELDDRVSDIQRFVLGGQGRPPRKTATLRAIRVSKKAQEEDQGAKESE